MPKNGTLRNVLGILALLVTVGSLVFAFSEKANDAKLSHLTSGIIACKEQIAKIEIRAEKNTAEGSRRDVDIAQLTEQNKNILENQRRIERKLDDVIQLLNKQ